MPPKASKLMGTMGKGGFSWKKGCAVGAAVVLAGLVLWLGPLVATVVRAGFLEAPEARTYEGGDSENLKRIHRALLLYAESEGVLPDASGWMDAAWTRLKTADMSEAEAKKQFQSAKASGPEEFGYAMNSELSRKDPFDDKLKSEPLIFESRARTWNSHGKVKDLSLTPPGSWVTLDGTLVESAAPLDP
jgi:hypothetical protein